MSLNPCDSDASTWLCHGSSVPSTTSTTSAVLRRNSAYMGMVGRLAGSAVVKYSCCKTELMLSSYAQLGLRIARGKLRLPACKWENGSDIWCGVVLDDDRQLLAMRARVSNRGLADGDPFQILHDAFGELWPTVHGFWGAMADCARSLDRCTPRTFATHAQAGDCHRPEGCLTLTVSRTRLTSRGESACQLRMRTHGVTRTGGATSPTAPIRPRLPLPLRVSMMTTLRRQHCL